MKIKSKRFGLLPCIYNINNKTRFDAIHYWKDNDTSVFFNLPNFKPTFINFLIDEHKKDYKIVLLRDGLNIFNIKSIKCLTSVNSYVEGESVIRLLEGGYL